MRKLSCSGLILSAVVFLIQTNLTFAQNSNVKLNQLDIPYTKKEIKIDGEIDESVWNDALVISLDLVNNPWNNLPSPVKTEAKLIENGKFLYIAFIADDPHPEEIKAFLGDRDSRWTDDIVGIKLDTFNNRRLNYSLFVNPFGVQNDSIYNEMTGEDNRLWDGIWQSFGKITKDGYQVEIAIPYHMLNFKESDEEKTWAIELVRIYPRDASLRISHVPLDRDNACWLCQYPEIKGFKEAKIGTNLLVTPAVVANSNQTRDIYDPQSDWQNENNVEAGLDLRWGINPNNSLNLTLNPDFSTVETDDGQLDVNKTFSLFYDEKRAFFLDNADYFSSNYDLVYTRNIADPDYGAKLTGSEGKHTYAAFFTNDTVTNFINPGNLGSSLTSLESESNNAALRYRNDINDDFSLGAVSTLRTSDDYYNYVIGFDGKFRFDDSNSILFQALNADSEYKFDGLNEKLSDQAYKINLKHSSEYWRINAEQQIIGKDFRADLGFMPKADYTQSTIQANRLFYSEGDSLWQEMALSAKWEIQHNSNNEFIEKSITLGFGGDGPKLAFYDIAFIQAEKVGLRHDPSNLAIDGNTTRFSENQLLLYGELSPLRNIFTALSITLGDKIDYSSDQLGDIIEVYGNITWNLNEHLELEVSHTYSKLSTNDNDIYLANLTDLRLSYQFNVQSYLKFNIVYSDIDTTSNEKAISTQLIYAYKLNPQTVFFLGYSDNSYQDLNLTKIEREQRTFFTKISYAWMP